MTLTIGKISLPHAAVLAPMSGVTDMPFRRAVRRAGGGLVVTEMIASAAILRQVKSEMRKLRTDTVSEVPLSVQLAGWDPQIMAEAARIAAARCRTLEERRVKAEAKNRVDNIRKRREAERLPVIQQQDRIGATRNTMILTMTARARLKLTTL